MTDPHWTYIALAYGFAAACLAIECVLLVRRRRAALARVVRERHLDETDAD
jgi:heme exporter protein D